MDYTIVGIDFGTSTTVVKVANYSGGEVKEYHSLQFNGSNTLPTLVFEAGDGRLYFGHEAESRSAKEKGELHRNFKMGLVGSHYSYGVEKSQHLCREFFGYLGRHFLGMKEMLNVHPTVKTYLSYPAKWPPEVRSFMKQCAVAAGFGAENTVHGETEPTAAVFSTLSTGLKALQDERVIVADQPINVMMLDMGAGTSDIAIFKFKIDSDGSPSIDRLVTYPTIDHTYLCGGREIDGLLEAALNRYLLGIAKGGVVPPRIIKRAKDFVKKWKDDHLSATLSEGGSTDLPFELADLIVDKQEDGLYDSTPYSIDRRQFESLSRPHWEQLRSLIADSIEEARQRMGDAGFKGAQDIDLVLLTGGHSKWYGVADFIKGESFAALAPINFAKIRKQPQRLQQEKTPQETVARGLAYRDVKLNAREGGVIASITTGNSSWVRYEVDGAVCGLVPIARHNDVLPIVQQSSFNHNATGSIFSTKEIVVKCDFLFGGSIETARAHTVVRRLPLPATLMRFGVGAVSAILTPLDFLVKGVEKTLGIQQQPGSALLEETYTVQIHSRTIIDNQERIRVDGALRIVGSFGTSDPMPFTIQEG